MTSLALRFGKNGALLAVACLLVAGCIGVSSGDHPLDSQAGTTHHDEGMAAMDHHDEPYNVPRGLPLPTIVTMDVVKDKKAGYNVHVTTSNFRFAPEHASGEHVEGEGHAHLYVDGVKINRVYGEWYHLPSLESGQRTIRMTLNANDHRVYARDGTPSAIEQTITVE